MKRIFFFLLIAYLFAACSPRALHEAQGIVAQADSVWHQGGMYSDSLSLAQAYETLGKISKLSIINHQSSIDYAHACYHYGKLLRAKDDPVTAMQAFIDATHSRTRDYHILGRIYSNMGYIALEANEYLYAFDMYQYSARAFILAQDSLMYYFAQNNMAYALAENREKDRAFAILNQLEYKGNYLLQEAIMETRAEAYVRANEYDSAICCADKVLAMGYKSPLLYMIKAQGYSFKDENDSATFYAQQIIDESNNLFLLANAYYILTNQYDTKDINGVRNVAANRADTQKLIEIRQGKLSQAVQLLEQDLKRKPNLTWLLAVIVTMLVTGSIAGIYIFRRRQKHQLLSQLESREKETLTQMRNKVDTRCALLKASPHITKDLCWKDFEQTCQIADQQFYMLASKLQKAKGLNETEIRLCILVLIGLNEKEISQTLPYAISSIGKLKYRVGQKIGITAKNLRDFLINFAIDEHVK